MRFEKETASAVSFFRADAGIGLYEGGTGSVMQYCKYNIQIYNYNMQLQDHARYKWNIMRGGGEG